METNKKIYNEILVRMKEKKMSYEELAEATSLSKTGLYNMIKKNSFKVDNLAKICLALDIPIDRAFSSKDGHLSFKGSKNSIKIYESLSDNNDSNDSLLVNAAIKIYEAYSAIALILFDLNIENKKARSKEETKGYIRAMFENGNIEMFERYLENSPEIVAHYKKVKEAVLKS